MKKVCISIMVAVFLIGSAASGIDRTKAKKEDLKESESKASVQLTDKDKRTDDTGSQRIKESPARDCNDFIDKDNNGIDDRAEKRKVKTRSDSDRPSKKKENRQPERSSESRSKKQ